MKHSIKYSFVFIILIVSLYPLLLTNIVLADTFNVTNETELRTALNSADNNRENDIINISSGSYETGGNPFVYQADSMENFSITLMGSGMGLTTLNGEGQDRVLTINTNDVENNSNTNINLKFLTIQNGDTIGSAAGLNIISKSPVVTIENCEFINNNASSSGGGASIITQSLTLKNSVFTNNITETTGGGILIDAGSLTLDENIFMNNSASGQGGGVFVFNAKTTTFTNNRFEGNQSIASDGGGAFIDSEDTTLITNNEFIGNSAGIQGGGAFILQSKNSTLNKNLIQDNSANQNGGGINISNSTDATLNNNRFIKNTSGSEGGGAFVDNEGNTNLNANFFEDNNSNNGGGGIAVVSELSILTDNIFLKNASINKGGGVNIRSSTSTLTNNTFTLNSISGDGGGGAAVIIPNDTGIANFYNNITFNNTSGTTGHDDIFVDDDVNKNNVGSTVNLFNNDFTEFFSVCENFIDCIPSINRSNNLDVNPLFVDANLGDVHLTEASPVIDKGVSNAPNLPPTDFDGNPRIIGPAPDMGALEFTGPRPPINVTIEKISNVNSVPPNQESVVVYTITIENVGDEDATNVVVDDNLPDDSNLASASEGCIEAVLGIVTCEVGTLQTGDERIFKFTIEVTPQGADLINEATVEFTGGQNQAISNIPVVGNLNVIIEKTSNTSSVVRGRQTQINYSIRVEGSGDEAARDVVVIDNLPDGASLISTSQGCNESDPGTIMCEVGTLPIGDERNFDIIVNITPEGASILNEAIVQFLGGQNSDSVTIAVTGAGGGSGGCSLSGGSLNIKSLIANSLILIIPLIISLSYIRILILKRLA